MDAATISDIERGVQSPDFATIEVLADALEVGIDELTGRKAMPPAALTDRPGSLEERVALLESSLGALEERSVPLALTTAQTALALAQRHEGELAPRRKQQSAG